MTRDIAKEIRSDDALLVVDVQRDFCPGGALAVPEGDAVVPVLNHWLEQAARGGAHIFASRDWHPQGHPSFSEQGGPWPPHCLQDSDGAAFHPDLQLPKSTRIVSKGTRFDHDQYSAFHETGLAEELRRLGAQRLWIGGLAQDVCVRATVLDARREGFEVRVLADAMRPVDPEKGEQARQEMADAGAELIEESA